MVVRLMLAVAVVQAGASGAETGAVRGVDEEFLDVMCADEELLRAEFDLALGRGGIGCRAVAGRPGVDHTAPVPTRGVGSARPRGAADSTIRARTKEVDEGR
jgi:hypothetical protein